MNTLLKKAKKKNYPITFNKKINLLKLALVPLTITTSFATLNTLVSCKKSNDNSGVLKTAKQNALDTLEEFMKIDVVLLYQKNTISEFALDVLDENNEEGLIHELFSLLSSKFSVHLDSNVPIYVIFNKIFIFLKTSNSISQNDQSWQQLTNLFKQINSKAYSAKKLSSQKILYNISIYDVYTSEIVGQYYQKKIETDFEFIEQEIGKRIKNSFNTLISSIEFNPSTTKTILEYSVSIEPINSETNLETLVLILSLNEFKNNEQLLTDAKANQLFEFATTYSHFFYLLIKNYFSQWTLRNVYIYLLIYKIKGIEEIIEPNSITIFEASFCNHDNTASELLKTVYAIDDTCPWIISSSDDSDNAKISSIPTFFESENFTSKYYSIPTSKIEELSEAIHSFLKEISIQWVKITSLNPYVENIFSKFFNTLNPVNRILERFLINITQLPINSLISFPSSKNNTTNELIVAYNKLLPNKQINQNSTFAQVFGNGTDFSNQVFANLLLDINLRGENMNDWSNLFGSLSKFFCFNLISFFATFLQEETLGSEENKAVMNDLILNFGFEENISDKTFVWLLNSIEQGNTNSWPSSISKYEENSIHDIIDINENSYNWISLFNALFRILSNRLEYFDSLRPN